MILENYSSEDLNMYLSGTFISMQGTPMMIDNIAFIDEDNDTCSSDDAVSVRFHMYHLPNDTVEHIFEDFPINYHLRTIPPTIGYVNYNNTVTYLYHVQQRYYKKLPSLQSIKVFNPQLKELEALNLPRSEYTPDERTTRKLILSKPSYSSLSAAYEALQDKKKFAIALHKNYALVKKANHKDLTIFYKTDPVLTYNGSELTALVDECHINKFLLEVQQ